jgi:hypothetical protein
MAISMVGGVCNMITPHTLQTESPADELAMLLVGDTKSGKSRLAATAPGNILFLETDRRLAALRTHPNAAHIFGLEFADDITGNNIPEAFNEEMDIISRLEASPRLRDVHNNFSDQPADKLVDTLVFDSVQTMADNARRYVMATSPDVAKSYTMGKKTYRVAKSYHAWGGEMEMVTGAILKARAILHCKTCLEPATYRKDPSGKGLLSHSDTAKKYDHTPVARAMNVIAILHECMEEDERSTQENPIYTGKIEVYPRRYNSLLIYFNEVWRLTRQNGKIPTVSCDPDGKFTQAATALGIDKITVPDIQQVLSNARSLRKQ